MTKQEFIATVNANGGPECVLTIVLDNSMFIKYLDDKHILNLTKDLVTINGVDYVKNYTMVDDKRPEKRVRGQHRITTLHPMECIQGIQFVDTPEERTQLDRTNLYQL